MLNSLNKLIFGLLLLLPLAVLAQDAFQEGTHYRRIANPVPTSTTDSGKVEVVELFWYGCPHCYNLEPALEAWVKNKPDNVEFVRIPAVFGPSWEIGARAYYTAESLGVLDKTHGPLFDYLHTKKRTVRNQKQLAAFFADQGIDPESFEKAFKSFDVETKLRRSKQLVKRYPVSGVPSIIVNGKYVVDSGDKVFEVVDYLIRKENEQS